MLNQTTRVTASPESRGVHVLRDPSLNRGTAFTEAERDALDLRGLLPPHVRKDIREVSARIAAAVAALAFREGLAQVAQPPDILAWVKSQMYQPHYAPTKQAP